jgi:hypothetical protein
MRLDEILHRRFGAGGVCGGGRSAPVHLLIGTGGEYGRRQLWLGKGGEYGSSDQVQHGRFSAGGVCGGGGGAPVNLCTCKKRGGKGF